MSLSRAGARMRALPSRLGLAAAAGLLTVLALEAALAVADYPPRYTEHQRLFVEYDSVRGWRNIPNGRGRFITPEFTVEMEYNARAYRGPLREYAKPAGTYRVLLLGDSFLEAYSVALEDRLAEVAERRFRERPGPQAVELVALGTAGYSTDQELLWLEAEGVRYDPDLVILLFVTNDVWFNIRPVYPRGTKPVFQLSGDSLRLTNVPVPRPAASPGGQAPRSAGLWRAARRFVRRESRLILLAERAAHRTAWLRGLGTRVGLVDAPAATVPAGRGRTTIPAEFVVYGDSLTPETDSALTMTAKLLARMQTRSRDAGARFVTVLVPGNDAIYPPGAPQSRRFYRTPPVGNADRPRERFRHICAHAAVPCVDLTERFVAAAASLARRGDLLVFPDDGHWNEDGHAVAADAVVALVRDAWDGKLPPVAPSRGP